PGVEKEVTATGPPSTNAPFPARSHAKPALGLAGSIEVDTSDTGSPVWGAGGNQRNDAVGGSARTGATGPAATTRSASGHARRADLASRQARRRAAGLTSSGMR